MGIEWRVRHGGSGTSTTSRERESKREREQERERATEDLDNFKVRVPACAVKAGGTVVVGREEELPPARRKQHLTHKSPPTVSKQTHH